MTARVSAQPNWTVIGPVVRGEQRGRELGYPTANVATSPDADLPDDGVYAGEVVLEVDNRVYPAAISVGTNPTFAGERRTVEAHLLDFDGDLYGQYVEVRSLYRLRGMVAFDSVTDLLVAIGRDVQMTRALFDEADRIAGESSDQYWYAIS